MSSKRSGSIALGRNGIALRAYSPALVRLLSALTRSTSDAASAADAVAAPLPATVTVARAFPMSVTVRSQGEKTPRAVRPTVLSPTRLSLGA